VRDTVIVLLKEEGIQGFFRGFGPTMIRAFVANAASLTCYEITLQLFIEAESN